MRTHKLSAKQLQQRLGPTAKPTSQVAPTTSTGAGINREENS